MVKPLLVEVSQQILLKALQSISSAVSAQSLIPILSGIKVEAVAGGLSLTAGKTDMMLQYTIPSDKDHLIFHRHGSIVIPARYFIEIIRNLQSGLLSIESAEDLKVVIRGGKAIYHLCGMNAEEFPSLAKINGAQSLRFQNGPLKKMIRQVSFATASSPSRPALTGVSCLFDEKQVKLVATDGIRLASRITPIEDNAQMALPLVIIPGKQLADFSKMLSNEHDTTDISIDNNMILFKTKNLIMQSSLIEGSFPSTDKLKPASYSTEITLESLPFLHALERVSLLSDDNNVIKLSLSSQNIMELSSKTAAVGNVVEEVDVESSNGDSITIFFNGQYMIDIMSAIDCRNIVLGFNGKWSPIIVLPIDSPDSLYIVTPIRARD